MKYLTNLLIIRQKTHFVYAGAVAGFVFGGGGPSSQGPSSQGP